MEQSQLCYSTSAAAAPSALSSAEGDDYQAKETGKYDSVASTSSDDKVTNRKKSPIVVERWILPVGAEQIILLLAAEEILHQMLNNKLGQPGQLEPKVLGDLVERFPGACLRTYEFSWEDGQTRELYPLAMLCCLRPPLWLTKLIHMANPKAICAQESKRGSLPLHYSCAFEAPMEVVQFLYDRYPPGASTPRNDQVYPLHLACGYYSGKPDVINFLLDKYPTGAGRRCTDLYWYPLHSAAQGGAPVSIMQRLYNLYPEGVTGLDKYGKTPLHTACRSKGNLENVDFLIRVGSQALQMEDYGHFKPIFLAAMYQTPAVIQLLLRHTRERVDNLGATLLHWAAVRNSPDVVEFLANEFPEMLLARTVDRDQYTPLLGACLNEGSVESIRVLIRRNRQTLFLADGDGRLPLQAALHANASAEIIQLLHNEIEKGVRGGEADDDAEQRLRRQQTAHQIDEGMILE
ncbi:hypothetical protein ACA910_009128 [Epithemia clementina (nom. ined.)]